jgi:hypothetical protein
VSSPEQPGPNPQDWQSPYAPPPTAPTYGPYGYEPQPYGRYDSPPPYAYRQPDEGPRTHAVIALVISAMLVFSILFSPGGITGAILSGIALGKVDTEPRQARSLLVWTWIALGVNLVLLVLFFGALFVLAANGD